MDQRMDSRCSDASDLPWLPPSRPDVVIAAQDPIAPDVLADLVVASALQSAADVITMRSHGDGCVVNLVAGGRTLGRLDVSVEVGFAAAARLAIAAGLSPPLPLGGPDGGGVALLDARVGDQTGEIVVSVSTRAGALDIELHPLFPHGRAPTRRVYLKRCPRCGAYEPPQRDTCDDDGAALTDVTDDPTVGGTIGTYRISAVLGQGSMGIVFAAEHAFIAKQVAVKVLHRALAGDVRIVRRFLREARAASRLQHRNVLEVTDFGILGDGRPFMVMERLSGEPLDRRLERAGALPVRMALLLAREIALALEAAHAAGVVHNDLKPSNVVLLEESTEDAPHPKLVDFGAASVSDEGADLDDVTIGTPHYMAPERVVGRVSDARSDIYALGILLFEVLSGQVPYLAATNAAVMLAQVTRPLPPVTSPFGAVPEVVSRFLKRSLEKDPADRQPTMRAVLVELDAAILAANRRGFWRLWT
jgi:serine/threonine-protein kinase